MHALGIIFFLLAMGLAFAAPLGQLYFRVQREKQWEEEKRKQHAPRHPMRRN